MASKLPLRRLEPGVYETYDGKYRILRWHATDDERGRPYWEVATMDAGHWTFTCELSPEFTLRDARAALLAHVRTERKAAA